MIQTEILTKNFDNVCAVNGVSFEIPEGVMYGLLGTNGAGKSTLLRLIAGILQADAGQVFIDGENCYDNPDCKSRLFYLPDTPYYFPNANMETMVKFYAKLYPEMDEGAVYGMADMLNLDVHQPLHTFSKGMKRQAFLIAALCANTRYLLCDEVFDGLDPVVTEVMKNLIRKEMKERQLTVVVVSHRLKELEDICERIGILHKGGLLSSADMKERLGNICKFQCVSERDEEWPEKERSLEAGLDLLKCQREGCFVTLIVRKKSGQSQTEIKKQLKEWFPVFCREIPVTLEETFMLEMEASGYDIRKVLY